MRLFSRLESCSAALLFAGLGGALLSLGGCSEAPTQVSAPVDGVLLAVDCAQRPSHPQCQDGGGDDPPATSESIPLEIVFGDAPGDVLTSDAASGMPYCSAGVSCYEDEQEFVGAHFSGGNNLIFWTTQHATGGDTPIRHVRVAFDGETLDFTGNTYDRIYTNTNVPNVEFGAMDPGGETVSTRLFVETGNESPYELRYGVDCAGNSQSASSVTVTRSGDVWTFAPTAGAYLCFTSGKGRKATREEDFLSSAPFTMTMTRVLGS